MPKQDGLYTHGEASCSERRHEAKETASIIMNTSVGIPPSHWNPKLNLKSILVQMCKTKFAHGKQRGIAALVKNRAV